MGDSEAEVREIAQRVVKPLTQMAAAPNAMVIESNGGVISPTVFQSARGNTQPSMRVIMDLVTKKAARAAPDAVYVIYQPLAGCRLIVALSAAGRLQYKLGDEGSSTWTAGRPTVFPPDASAISK